MIRIDAIILLSKFYSNKSEDSTKVAINQNQIDVPTLNKSDGNQFMKNDSIESWLATNNFSEFVTFFKETLQIIKISDLERLKSLDFQELVNLLIGSNIGRVQLMLMSTRLKRLQIIE